MNVSELSRIELAAEVQAEAVAYQRALAERDQSLRDELDSLTFSELPTHTVELPCGCVSSIKDECDGWSEWKVREFTKECERHS